MHLAIDTTTDTASVALVEDNEVLAELSWRSGQNHGTQLLPNLAHLLSQTGLSLQSVGSIMVARGPGSYNGLRVGISTAKALAFSLNIPIVGISTLEVVAYPHAETGLPIYPIFNAGRGEIATAGYRLQDGDWHQLASEHLTTVDALCAEVAGTTLFCGELTPLIISTLKERLGERAVIPSTAALLRRAGFLAELGLRRVKAGDCDDVASLQPLYLRRPAITKPKHR